MPNPNHQHQPWTEDQIDMRLGLVERQEANEKLGQANLAVEAGKTAVDSVIEDSIAKDEEGAPKGFVNSRDLEAAQLAEQAALKEQKASLRRIDHANNPGGPLRRFARNLIGK